VTEPKQPDELEVERQAREVARGQADATPAKLFVGMHLFIGVVVGAIIVVVLLVWYFAG
jgi:hypothetical protein